MALVSLLVSVTVSCSNGGSSNAGSGGSAGRRTGGSNAGGSGGDSKSTGDSGGHSAGGAASGGSSGGASGGAAGQAGGNSGGNGGGTTSAGAGGRSTGGAGGGISGRGGTSSIIDAGTGTSFFVAPTGSDSNPGTMAEPFKTIAKARDQVRTINASMTDDITVYLRGGTYNLTETLKFDPTDSGGNGHRIFYRAYPGETPVIMAATQVTGWTQDKGNVYKASLSRKTKLRSLYVNDKRAYMASKNMSCQGSWGNYAVTAGSAPWAWSSGSHADGAKYNPSDFPAIASNADDIEIESGSTWNKAIVCVREVTSEASNRIAKLQQPYGAIAQRVDSGAAFNFGFHTVWNAYEFLSSPGQFYFDKTAGTVYYYKNSDEDMATATVYAPSGLETLVSIAGTSTANRVKSLTFYGLTFKYSDWNLANVDGSCGKTSVQGSAVQIVYEQGQYQAGYMGRDDVLPDAIRVDNADSIVFERNVIAHTGAEGIGFINDVSNSQIIGNLLYDLAGSAIVLSHPQHVYIGDWTATNHEKYRPEVEGACSKDVIKDNFISQTTRMFKGNAAVAAFYPDTLLFTHNVVMDTAYNGLSMGWGWWNFDGSNGSVAQGKPTTTMKNNTVTYNQFFNVMQALMDSGAVYTLAAQPGSLIDHNYVRGVPPGQGRYGFHSDEGSAYITTSNNVLDTDLKAQHSINVGDWGKQHDHTYKNNYATKGDYAFQDGGSVKQAPNSTYEPLKTYSDTIWPVEAYNICVGAGIEPAYQDIILATAIPLQDIVFPASVTVAGGTALTIKSTGDATNVAWFAPSGTTSFSAGPTMTKTEGTSTTLAAPSQMGTYRLFVQSSAGAASAPSSAKLVVR